MLTGLDSPAKGQALFDAQQDAIEEAIRTGETVAFENVDGEIVEVTVERVTGGDRARYTVAVGEDSFDVESKIVASDTSRVSPTSSTGAARWTRRRALTSA